MPNDSEYATVRVYEKVSEYDQKSILLFDFDRLSSLEELRAHINYVLKTSDSVKIQINLKFLKYTVLPAIYDREMIHGLCTLATCDNLDLQKHAHNFAERLLLKEKFDSSYSGISILVKLKTMLIESIELMSQDKSFDPNKKELIKRKCLLLYWVHLDIVLQARRQEDLGDVNLKLSRSQEQKEPIKMFFSSTNKYLSLSFDEARQFQKDVLQWNVQDETIVVGQKEYKQFYSIVDLLKQMFKIQNSGDRILNCLKNLESYLLTKTGIRRQNVSPLCTELIKQGTLQLLTYISNLEERCLKQNITAICQKVLDILRICKRNGTLEITRTLRSLVFSPKKEVRSLALQFFDGKNEFQKSIELLFLEEVQEYFPALRIHHKLTPRTEHMNYWLNISGKFMKSKFRASVYIPLKENLITSNRTKFEDKKDLLKERHIQILCRLHHPNIVTLYAFNMDCMPEFYIQEQSSEENSKNLQQYLVNKSQNNNNVCTTKTLIQFLLDAAAAVKFCHDKNIILRDITAASFIVVNKNSVKLSKFRLAIDLAGKMQIKQNNVDYNQVPTRWSAPESLLRLIWSKLSDVWMFGMLMFEVLTHGVLPFSHIKLKDEDWLRHLSRSSIKVKHEGCLSVIQYEVILQCTDYDTTKRPTMSELEKSLNIQFQNGKQTSS
ncbi:uncharacterized protein LOC129923607 isoform X1 [Biomphalaria glabrata]|uniref:Uncharacterized protein LOC129923607 isoform X1 n=1 Tax=Biomphalaria glabrata TaxID=6526 RepID=A0A9W2Z8J9_BIOGL|nr:uncharacterized protein LOC129923607 isoform X1 [Biomphalaria glabrata]